MCDVFWWLVGFLRGCELRLFALILTWNYVQQDSLLNYRLKNLRPGSAGPGT